MSKANKAIVFLCSNCGTDYPKWLGQCLNCKEWGTLSEYKVPKGKRRSLSKTPAEATPLKDVLQSGQKKRISTRITEVDRVLGGGMLPGSLILLGGNPGIGKSTLALQMLGKVKNPSLYISAEESEDQIAMRAKRLGISSNLSWEANLAKFSITVGIFIPHFFFKRRILIHLYQEVLFYC